jgi:hypothetical protein
MIRIASEMTDGRTTEEQQRYGGMTNPVLFAILVARHFDQLFIGERELETETTGRIGRGGGKHDGRGRGRDRRGGGSGGLRERDYRIKATNKRNAHVILPPIGQFAFMRWRILRTSSAGADMKEAWNDEADADGRKRKIGKKRHHN